MTCIYSYLSSPINICTLLNCNDSLTQSIKAMYPRSLAIACFVSKLTIVYKNIRDFCAYKKKLELYELYFPVDISKKQIHRLFTIAIILTYIIIILPINILRVYLIYQSKVVVEVIIFYTLMYVQNLSICSTEIHFMVRCFGLQQKFQLINEKMSVMKLETININRYPVVLHSEETARDKGRIGTVSDSDLSFARMDGRRLSKSIELLRTRHQFLRNSLRDLNDLYGIQLGLSLFLLFMLALFDIYGEVFSNNSKARADILIYGWMLQYSFRFYSIIMTTHSTTKQVFLLDYLMVLWF